MGRTPRYFRRTLLLALSSASAIGLLAGCSGTPGENGGRDSPASGSRSPSNADDSGSDETRANDADSGGRSELDLREANVVDVVIDGSDGEYSFDVTLHHDDEGEDGYADWWQVERLDGTRIGRRDLLHAHAQQPFTRSDTFEIPSDVRCVAVRGHDQTHGYGGRMMVVNVASAATRAVDQGADRQPVDESDCP
ncbi:hypothetical protein [Halobellus captivus]|uniref:hypothetical protein n=1 Tax=Halobellus captivus TaxID=2592614 RepID=UPI0011A43510|nr:hypothetical protein [Halobellus captivus]